MKVLMKFCYHLHKRLTERWNLLDKRNRPFNDCCVILFECVLCFS